MELADFFAHAARIWQKLNPESPFGLPRREMKEVLVCSQCFQEAAMTCACCKVLRYCSKDCQRKHWKTHKPECLAAKKEDGSLSLKPMTAWVELPTAVKSKETFFHGVDPEESRRRYDLLSVSNSCVDLNLLALETLYTISTTPDEWQKDWRWNGDEVLTLHACCATIPDSVVHNPLVKIGACHVRKLIQITPWGTTGHWHIRVTTATGHHYVDLTAAQFGVYDTRVSDGCFVPLLIEDETFHMEKLTMRTEVHTLISFLDQFWTFVHDRDPAFFERFCEQLAASMGRRQRKVD
jgi:hypothetical protein